MSVVFLGMACLLAAATGYWVLGRGTTRPAGTWAMAALLGSFALAFASYAPVFTNAVESVVPEVSRLLSNIASLAAATSVLAVSFQMNLDVAEARARIRRRVALFAVAALTMTGLFACERLAQGPTEAYALYLLVYVSCLGLAVVGFLLQAVRHARATGRDSVRAGLRVSAVGCVAGLVYVGYKLTVLFPLLLGHEPRGERPRCSSLVAFPCVFSVTTPAVSVLLICLGVTLPAVVYPISQARRRRWEVRSFEALRPLWQDLAAAVPQIVLSSGDAAGETDFLLQRRVIEISDGILALRPYRSLRVQEATARAMNARTEKGAAVVEAAVVEDALAAARTGRLADNVAPPSAEAASRKDLRGDTEWLLLVAEAYARRTAERVADKSLAVMAGG